MENSAVLYTAYCEELRKYEREYENSPLAALINMTDLYCKLSDTNFHDLWDAIELWVDNCGNRKLLDYIVKNNNPKMRRLQEIMEYKTTLD